MTTSDASTTQEVWFKFLRDTVFAKNYQSIGVVAQPWVPRSPNPILDELLPSLLFTRLCSILDEALGEYIDSIGIVIARPYRDDLNGRIRILADQGRLNDPGRLHDIRRRRNTLAHEANPVLQLVRIRSSHRYRRS